MCHYYGGSSSVVVPVECFCGGREREEGGREMREGERERREGERGRREEEGERGRRKGERARREGDRGRNEGKLGEPKEKPLEQARINNILDPHETTSMEVEFGS